MAFSGLSRPYHPGWAGWFTWGGYRGRLSYLGATLLVGLAVGAVVVALGSFAGIGAERSWSALTLVAIAGIAVAVLAGFVAWVCVLAQRMRDIGMPVVPSLVGYGLASPSPRPASPPTATPESAALWSADFPLWLNLLQVALAVFALALVIVPGNAWLDEE